MKKFTILSMLAVVFILFGTSESQAHSYPARVISKCNVCYGNVYAYYKPINYYGSVRYMWVPSYHTACAARARSASSVRYVTKYHRGTPYTYAVPSTSYRSYSRPGFSITIRR